MSELPRIKKQNRCDALRIKLLKIITFKNRVNEHSKAVSKSKIETKEQPMPKYVEDIFEKNKIQQRKLKVVRSWKNQMKTRALKMEMEAQVAMLLTATFLQPTWIRKEQKGVEKENCVEVGVKRTASFIMDRPAKKFKATN